MEKTFNSFKELADYMKIKTKEKRVKEEKPIKCKVCGSEMHKMSDSNIIICMGIIKDKDGKEKPCKNYIILNK